MSGVSQRFRNDRPKSGGYSGWCCCCGLYRYGRKRVARLMRQAGLAGRAPKRWKKTTIPDPAAAARVDRIRRDFTAGGSGRAVCQLNCVDTSPGPLAGDRVA
jgi:transposase InsO family protein